MNRTVRILLLLILALAMVLPLVACGPASDPSPSPSKSSDKSTGEKSSEPSGSKESKPSPGYFDPDDLDDDYEDESKTPSEPDNYVEESDTAVPLLGTWECREYSFSHFYFEDDGTIYFGRSRGGSLDKMFYVLDEPLDLYNVREIRFHIDNRTGLPLCWYQIGVKAAITTTDNATVIDDTESEIAFWNQHPNCLWVMTHNVGASPIQVKRDGSDTWEDANTTPYGGTEESVLTIPPGFSGLVAIVLTDEERQYPDGTHRMTEGLGLNFGTGYGDDSDEIPNIHDYEGLSFKLSHVVWDTNSLVEGVSGDDSDELKGVGYMWNEDAFYEKNQIVATWVNVWYGSTEGWYRIKDAESEYVAKIKVNGTYVTPNNNDADYRQEIFNQASEAGIDALLMDLTNGYRGWTNASKDYQRLCYENGKKFSVAVHPREEGDIETYCKFIWDTYAGPGAARYSSAFLYKDGKPVIVLYCTIPEYNLAVKATGEYRDRFTLVWASGEDSKIDKWGWQIVPTDGPMLSSDSMFVTDSICWNSPNVSRDAWRKSLAMLDFCFLAAKEAGPKYLIVGMIDDIHERNAWFKADTSQVVYDIPVYGSDEVPEYCRALQMRDIFGVLSEDVYFNRVKDWIAGEATAFVSGGLIPDGAYTITNVEDGAKFGVVRPAKLTEPATDVSAVFRRNYNVSTDMETYYWFYYLGNDEYRITKLTSGLSLVDKNGSLIQEYDSTASAQRWTLRKLDDGSFMLINKSTGKAITNQTANNQTITLNTVDESNPAQCWNLTPVENRIME